MAVQINEKTTDTQVILPPSSVYLVTPTAASWSVWIYQTTPESLTDKNEYIFFTAGGGLKMYHQDSSTVRYETFILTSGTPGYFICGNTAPYFPPILNQWAHICGTYDINGGTNNLKLYISGVFVSGVTCGTYNPQSTWYPSIGGAWNHTGEFAGAMADVRVYDRALSANEVLTIYNGYGNDDIHYGLIGRWMLNEGAENQKVFVNTTGIFKDMGPYGLHATSDIT